MLELSIRESSWNRVKQNYLHETDRMILEKVSIATS